MRKLLGLCSLQAFAHSTPAQLLDPLLNVILLADYIDLTAEALRAASRSARAEASGNSYGESVLELALGLLYELQARPGDWAAFAAAIGNEHKKIGAFWDAPGGDAILRKKINDMYAGLRDKVDADNYQAACGRSCSPNKIYAYRMLDTAYGDIARIFDGWQQDVAQLEAILARPVAPAAAPIEVRQMKSIASCRPEWVIRWSESRERFTGAPGPLHTRSKRFASLKNSPEKIGAMLLEIGGYEELSANRDCDWQQDAFEAAAWLDDLARACDESEQAHSTEADQILEAGDDPFAGEAQADTDAPEPPPEREHDERIAIIAISLSLPPRFMEMARAAQDNDSWSARMMDGDSLPVRLAVYLKMLGSVDESYPAEWLDPATCELPTMQQLAALDLVSLPTLRKRRDTVLARLLVAARP